MCGIAGIIRFDGESVSEARLLKMRSFLRERGPDDQGLLVKQDVGIAHTRLSIVDLSELGHQPMTSLDGQRDITFNGEIYNFKPLRDELIGQGVRFRSATDTEVLLEGYKEWGIVGLLERIDGMFAFVLVDHERRVAYACRDRFGQKPLYYKASVEEVLFSSDLRSIAAVSHDVEIDWRSIDYYLSELSSPQPQTVYRGIFQVKPAHFLTIDLDVGETEETRYWCIDFEAKIDVSLDEALDLVETGITDAVVRRIHGDVPIAAFLSSGIDSGLVTAILAMKYPKRLRTFTVTVSYEEYDEAPFAKQLADRYNTEHQEIAVNAGDIDKLLDTLIEYCGEPFADSSLIPSYLICKTISGDVKVALSGDGGDEMFGGYFNYADAYAADRYLKKSSKRGALANTASLFASKGAHRLGLTAANEGNAAAYASQTGAQRLFRSMGFTGSEKQDLYTESFKEQVGGYWVEYLQRIWDRSNKVSITDSLLEASLGTRLLNDYLVKIDRASMISSLEVRSPFLDHHLAQLCASLPAGFHLKHGIPKYLTKKLAEKYVDPKIMDREKRGFSIPVGEWLRNELYGSVREVLENSQLAKIGVIEKQFAKDLLNKHKAGLIDATNKIWALYCLEKWLDIR